MRRIIKKSMLFCSLGFLLLNGCSKRGLGFNRIELLNEQDNSNFDKHDGYDKVQTYYDSTLELDEDKVIEIPSDYRLFVLDSLCKDKDDSVTVHELSLISSLEISVTDQDLSWINYCINLRDLKLKYAYRTDVSKYIKELPSLRILTINSCSEVPIELREQDFSFIKNIEVLNIRKNIDIDTDFLKRTKVNTMNIVSTELNRIDYKELVFLKNLIIDKNDVSPYNTAIYFTTDDKNYLESKGVYIETGKKIDEINSRLDVINSMLGINDNDLDLVKYKKIASYVIKKLYYGDVDEELGAKPFYQGGNLYGALEGNGAICGNYAALVEALCLRNNIDAYILSSGKYGRHAWNLVKIANKYYHSDITNVDHFDYLDPKTKKIISSEEYVDKFGISDIDMKFFLFKTGEIKDDIFNYVYLPMNYIKEKNESSVKRLVLNI
ncbi:MAG: hypothetical protein IJH20_05430 [Bacilli bacterium]|nr:hypothetical protein [Bacilli bacterium]